MSEIRDLIGREVEVLANGIVYRGVLVEVSDTEVHLKGSMQWLALSAADVSSIRPCERRMVVEEEPGEAGQTVAPDTGAE